MNKVFLLLTGMLVGASESKSILQGNTKQICPGDTGIFLCTTFDSVSIAVVIFDDEAWVFKAVFNGFEPPSTITGPLFPGHTAVYLTSVNITLTGSNRGNRTARLSFVPGPETKGVFTIVCDDRNGSKDNISVTIEGNSYLTPPTNFSVTASTNTLRWSHDDEGVISHYIVELEGYERYYYVDTTLSFPIPEHLIPFSSLNGTVTAVSVCGFKSDPLPFQVAGTVIEATTSGATTSGATTSKATGLKSITAIIVLCLMMLY